MKSNRSGRSSGPSSKAPARSASSRSSLSKAAAQASPEHALKPSRVTQRHLNRWTLARQMLLERARLDPVTAIERLAGMQAQYPPAPYIGLWSRLQDFRREDLESAIKGDRVLKATLMRATLHLVSARTFSAYRLVAPDPYTVYTNTARLLRQHGLDPAAARRRVRERVLAVVRKRPVSRAELGAIVREETGDGVPLPNPAGWGAAAAYGDLISVVDDALFVFPREA